MNRYENLMEALNKLQFSGKLTCLERLYEKLEHLIFYLEANGQIKLAEQIVCYNWKLKERMQHDKEEQWLWTFVWMKDKVLRKLEVEADPSASLRKLFEVEVETKFKDEMEMQVFSVQECLGSRYASSSPNHLLIGQSLDKNAPLGMGYL